MVDSADRLTAITRRWWTWLSPRSNSRTRLLGRLAQYRRSLLTLFALLIAVPLIGANEPGERVLICQDSPGGIFRMYPTPGPQPCGADARIFSVNGPKQSSALQVNGRTLRFELRPGEMWVRDRELGHKAERVELSDLRRFSQDRPICISYDLLIEPGPPTQSTWTILSQLRAGYDHGKRKLSPPVSLRLLKGDILDVTLRTSDQPGMTESPPRQVLYRKVGFKRGVTHAFEWKILYSPKSDGLLQLSIDGQTVVSYRGPLGYNDTQDPYFKFGLYRSPSSDVLAARFSNVRLLKS